MNAPLSQIYINIPLAIANNASAIAPEKLAQVQQQQGLIAKINLNGHRLTSKGLAWWRPDSTIKLVPSKTSPETANLVPDSTLLMVSGNNLAQLWQDYLPLATNNPWAPLSPEVLRTSLKSATGLDLDTDILTWSSNEFGAALLPPAPTPPTAAPSSLNNSGSGAWLLLVKSTDQQATNTTLAKLDQVMASRYQFQVAKGQSNQVDLINWSTPVGGIQAQRGWLPDQRAFLLLGAPLAEQFLPQPSATLARQQTFQQVMSSEIAPQAGQFYLHLDRLQQVYPILLSTLPANAQTMLGAIEAIGVTSNATSATSQRFDLSITLKQLAGSLPATP